MEEGQAIELPRTRRGTGQPTELSQQPRASRPSHGRRSTLAAVAQQLQQQEAEEEAQEVAVAAGEANGRWSTISKAEVVLLTYTYQRIIANISVVSEFYIDLDDPRDMLVDGIIRPMITGFGVYCFLHRKSRFSSKSKLHLWSRRVVCCLALFVADASGLRILNKVFYSMTYNWLDRMSLIGSVVILWEAICNAMQLAMTNLKLRLLGRRNSARVGEVLTAVACSCLCCIVCIIVSVTVLDAELDEEGFLATTVRALKLVTFLTSSSAVVLQSLTLCFSATMALRLGIRDPAVRCSSCCLYVNAALTFVGPILSGAAFFSIVDRGSESQLPITIVTLDVGFQVLSVLLMSGMIGPKGWQRPMESFRKLADLSGFGLAAKRIAFPGKISQLAKHCIVSFPGKYSEDWDTAVSTVQHVGGCSLACVFLTDRASGLGCHAENPDTPGQCWCHALYGELPGSAYLMVVDMHDEVNGPLTEEELAFKKADALAMGLVLVIKEDQCDLEWETELAQALQKAEELCRQNGGRAPWGCMWFQEWLKNLNEAHERGQILHVFYFEGKVGCGKLPWEKLCDADAKDEARRNTGLGASQTAEVAYLEKLGLPYQEHDIRDFATFLRSHAR